MKFKKEKYINQRQLKSGWSFQVIIRKDDFTITRSFNELEYGSARLAFNTAVAYRDKKLNEIVSKKIYPSKFISLQDLFLKMQDDSVDSKETKRKDLINFNKRIPFHDYPFEDITPAIIQDSINKCIIDSNDVIKRTMALWRKIYNYAIMHGYASIDYTRMVKTPKSHKVVKKRPVLYDGDFDLDKLNKISNAHDRNLLKIVIQIIKYTGARPGEILALCKSDIHSDRICINKWLGDNRDDPVPKPCKTEESVREIPIATKLKPIIKELFELSSGEQLFILSNGLIMTSKWVGEKINYYSKGFNLYMLRHRASTIWDKNRVSLRTIDELMGHKSSSMSTDYARSDWAAKIEAIEML